MDLSPRTDLIISLVATILALGLLVIVVRYLIASLKRDKRSAARLTAGVTILFLIAMLGASVTSAWYSVRQLISLSHVTEFHLPTPSRGPRIITSGLDGALWFTEIGVGEDVNKIGRLTTTGQLTEYSLPTPKSAPYVITSGPDGALWFTELTGNRIGRLTTDGQLTEFPVPTPMSEPNGITSGPDGALWFTEYDANKIGRLTTTGQFTEFPRPHAQESSLEYRLWP